RILGTVDIQRVLVQLGGLQGSVGQRDVIAGDIDQVLVVFKIGSAGECVGSGQRMAAQVQLHAAGGDVYHLIHGNVLGEDDRGVILLFAVEYLLSEVDAAVHLDGQRLNVQGDP